MSQAKIAFIGAGNMSRAIIAGMIADGYSAQNIVASNPSMPKLQALNTDFSVLVTQSNAEAAAEAEVVVLAIKPQLMAEMCADLASQIDLTGKLFISIAAGITSSRLKQMLGGDYPIVRTMPNTPSQLGKGMTGLYADASVNEEQRKVATELMQTVGEIIWVEDEPMIDAVIAAAGSSPAYFFLFLEAMQRETQNMGFSPQAARLLVQQAMLGAAEMVCHNPDLEIGQLRAQVTSKGGTTAQAIAHFEKSGLTRITAEAMRAAVARAEQMSSEF